jgi:hypothetical protein
MQHHVPADETKPTGQYAVYATYWCTVKLSWLGFIASQGSTNASVDGSGTALMLVT